MKITIITLFPQMISGFIEESILKRAQNKGVVEIEIVNVREFAIDDYGTVDDRPYGGGAGMVLKVEPIYKALEKIEAKNGKVVLTSPKGRLFTQKVAQEYSKLDHLIIIAGHYEEVDERVRDYVNEEISLGDFVMTGGEITAAAIVDAVTRLIPGALKKEEATQLESFFEVDVDELIKVVGEDERLGALKRKGVQKVQLLEYPHYTRPEEFNGKKVPDILLSGHHKQIEDWKLKMAYEETKKKRPDLISLDKLQTQLP
jgi:tRNA (guanine37-N1)-methyltransferase